MSILLFYAHFLKYSSDDAKSSNADKSGYNRNQMECQNVAPNKATITTRNEKLKNLQCCQIPKPHPTSEVKTKDIHLVDHIASFKITPSRRRCRMYTDIPGTNKVMIRSGVFTIREGTSGETPLYPQMSDCMISDIEHR